jgi:pseudouridine-5'-phosphate glycosidase
METEEIAKMIKDLPDYQGKPAVALETTIISHGMPYPQNVKTALAVEQAIRDQGAIPVTIGILDGRIIIGMTPDQIEEFGRRHAEIMKVSRRDIAYCVANGKSGATTVAATMILANLAHIKVFATGGLGGVHRGAQQTFDISADLGEFGKTPVNVVCSGPKAILDIPLTLEYLETQGVPVVGFQTSHLPLFYTRDSKYKLEAEVGSPEEAANLIKTSDLLGLHQGMIFANPIPEKYSLDGDKMEKVIEEAVKDADEKGVKGKDLTPFLLAKIVELTGGESLEANIALIKNNAKVAAQISLALNK